MFTAKKDVKETLGDAAGEAIYPVQFLYINRLFYVGRVDYIKNGNLTSNFFTNSIDARELPIFSFVPILPFSILVCAEVIN